LLAFENAESKEVKKCYFKTTRNCLYGKQKIVVADKGVEAFNVSKKIHRASLKD
jgi:hypothetical protein